jgi:betaine-aldehyde dehydrogenase
MLTTHPRIAKVSLTGEVGTGRAVMSDAAATLKKVTMELGGKSPLIVFADADIENAVSAALLANFYTQGEICTNGTRVFVQRKLLAAFLDRLVERTRKLRVGDPMKPDTEIGALISAAHRDRVLSYIEAGKKAGARLLCGGERPADPALADGYFVMPTIFAECTDAMTIVREEIFGPVMAVLAFDAEAEVIQRANDTEFGLAAGVFTRDLARAHRVVAALEAGVCWINNYNVTPVEAPFGGNKQSGIGRENGSAAIEHYTQLKSVYVELGDVACPYR